MDKSAKADAIARLAPTNATRIGTTVSVREVMRATVISLRPDADLETAGSLLVSCNVDALPVVDDAGRPIGCVSMRDMLREVVESAEWHPTTMRVAEVMSRELELVPADATLAQAAAGLAGAASSTAVVVTADGKLVGMLRAADILAWLAERGGQKRVADQSLLRLPVAVP